LRDMSYLGYVDPPTASLRGANLALENLPQLLQPLRQVEHHSRPHWERWLRETEGVEALIPDHGIIAFPKLDGVEDTLSFASYLAREHQVDVVPGEYFGMAGHIRLGCGVPEETLVEGLKRLTAGIEAWRSGEGRDEG
ncbi:MAG: aminotransferase class I/II-fold pyridoxal phosphate-dependent enzyme, partial [Planctomycetota bacterium]